MKKDSVESTKYGREKNSTLLSFRMFFPRSGLLRIRFGFLTDPDPDS